jgi:hypothetical protein
MKGLEMTTTTEIYCCENAQMPKGMKAGHGLFGGYVATCENCNYVCGYWECACELVHDCKENN